MPIATHPVLVFFHVLRHLKEVHHTYRQNVHDQQPSELRRIQWLCSADKPFRLSKRALANPTTEKTGSGGFADVFKVQLEGGQTIAMKELR